MQTLSIPIPDGLPQALQMSDEEFVQEARLVLAAKLYELGRISSGVAAQMAGYDRLTFLALLDRYGIPAINLRDEEVDHEIAAATRLAAR